MSKRKSTHEEILDFKKRMIQRVKNGCNTTVDVDVDAIFKIIFKTVDFECAMVRCLRKTSQKIARKLITMKKFSKSIDEGTLDLNWVILKYKTRTELYFLAIEIAILLELLSNLMNRTKSNSMIQFNSFNFNKDNYNQFTLIFKINKTFYSFESKNHAVYRV